MLEGVFRSVVLNSAVLEEKAAFTRRRWRGHRRLIDWRIMLSFDQARKIAYEELAPTWEVGECGEYTVADYGYEDETAWLLIDGGSRLVIDGDYSCQLIGRGSTLVDKRTGEIFSLTYLEDPDRFDAMRPVGQHPDEDQ